MLYPPTKLSGRGRRVGPEAGHDRDHIRQVEGETASEKVCRHLGRGGRGVQDASGDFD